MTQLNSNTKQAFQYGLASFQYVYRERIKAEIRDSLKAEVIAELKEELTREIKSELTREFKEEIKGLIKGMKKEIQNEFAFYHVDSPMAPLPTIPEERINHDWVIPESDEGGDE